MDLYIATTNKNKVKEIKDMLERSGVDMRVFSAENLGGMPEVEETEPSFEGNARLKARALAKFAPKDAWVLGEDSGLCVEALNGAPGIKSARFAGEKATDEQNNNKLLKELQEVPMSERGAHYQCCMVLYNVDHGEVIFQSMCKGTILDTPAGDEGFGYDPLFVPLGQTMTFAELGLRMKSLMSHRAQALRQLIVYLKSSGVGDSVNPKPKKPSTAPDRL